VSGFPIQVSGAVPKNRPPDLLRGPTILRVFFVLHRVVSFGVILLRFPVDLRGPSHNTDAQNIAKLLLLVVTPPSNEAHGVQGVVGSSPAVPTA